MKNNDYIYDCRVEAQPVYPNENCEFKKGVGIDLCSKK